jgi:hypothetical protein
MVLMNHMAYMRMGQILHLQAFAFRDNGIHQY